MTPRERWEATGGPSARSTPLAWALIALGLLLIVASALWLASAGYGTTPKQRFAERRSYDMVKPEVQRAFPRALAGGLAGLALAAAGLRLRARARDDAR